MPCPHDTASHSLRGVVIHFDLLQANLLSPVVLAFLLGAVAVWVRSDLSLPKDLYTGLSIYLLLAIGLKGGQALAQTSLAELLKPAIATILLGVTIPLLAYGILRQFGKFSAVDAAAVAAHYGSVSAVTFAAAQNFLDSKGVPYEGFMPALVAILEVPAIVIAVLIARLAERRQATPAGVPPAHDWKTVLREVFAGRSIVLLLGGLAMGAASTSRNMDRVSPLFTQLFYGALVLFLLEMGMTAARRLKDVRAAGLFLAVFAILMPLFSGALGVLLGDWAGLSFGGTVILGVLSASASYIAAPAAVRVALPVANPAYYVTASIGITFPFNLTIGIPLIYGMAKYVCG